MKKHIGNVKINYNFYQGADLYSDGDVEDELLSIVQLGGDYEAAIQERMSWPILYHLSDQRINSISWLPFSKKDNVLEIGSGCGALSGELARLSASVTAIELSKRRSLINAYKNKSCDNLEIYVGNFENICEKLKCKYDVITLIGVFEYAASYIKDSLDPYSGFLSKVDSLLSENGKIIIAIENRIGLKYWAGCREDHLGTFFEGIEGYGKDSPVKTFSRTEWVRLLERNGFKDYSFYYPYPDYKFPSRIFSDSCLPGKGDLILNLRNFDSDRFVMFDESKAFDKIVNDGLFCEFSNSFLLVISGRHSRG